MARSAASEGRARGVCVILPCLLASCFTIGTRTGYEPSEAIALYEGPLPPGSPATPVVALPAGALVLVQASRGQVHPMPGLQITLDVRVLVPEDVSVEMLVPELELLSPAWPEPRTLPIVCIEDWTASPRSVQAPAAVLRGTAQTHAYPGFGLGLFVEGPRHQTRIPAVDEFELRLPAFRVGAEVVAPAPIRLRAWERSGVWWAVD